MPGQWPPAPATALREHLLDTAGRLLAERPVSAITTRETAHPAGVSESVLYNHFADKNDLLLAAQLRRYQAAMEQRLIDYLKAEQRVGRLWEAVDGDAVNTLLVGATALLALAGLVSPADADRQLTEEVPAVATTLVRGLGT